MKIALLSDLHANRQAVEAVWQHAQERGFDQLVMLGDYVDYGADPVWVVEFAQAREAEGAVLVRGNHDDALSAETTSTNTQRTKPPDINPPIRINIAKKLVIVMYRCSIQRSTNGL